MAGVSPRTSTTSRSIEKVDESRDIFDKYLPFAVAFGLEDSWVSNSRVSAR